MPERKDKFTPGLDPSAYEVVDHPELFVISVVITDLKDKPIVTTVSSDGFRNPFATYMNRAGTGETLCLNTIRDKPIKRTVWVNLYNIVNPVSISAAFTSEDSAKRAARIDQTYIGTVPVEYEE